MFLCVGLGNPGPSYAETRHNIGWIALDFLKEELSSLRGPTMKFQGALWDGRLGEERILCLKPLTYMNLSGRSVQEAARYYRIEPSRILVLYDDRALPFESLRIRKKGSPGGHNGMASVISSLGTPEVPRLRIGIGPLPAKMALRNFVLAPFSSQEKEALPSIGERCFRGVSLWVNRGIDAAMNSVNVSPSS